MSLLEMVNISKSFYGVEVLHSVNFTLKQGTVHALMGENGAGKSTLMKILAGIHKPDSGTVHIDGKPIEINNPLEARQHGIAMIHQELTPVNEMTVAENIFLGREPVRNGLIDHKKLYKDTSELMERLNISINPKAKMKDLSVADQQMIEIAKAISQNARIVIMDEPTSSITDREVEILFNLIRDLKSKGTGIIYISHKIDEIMKISDEISILRDGTNVGTWQAGEIDIDTIIRNMVGRELKSHYHKVSVPIGEKILEVKNLTIKGQFEDISFDLHKGEILGFVGLIGSGRTELMDAIFGLTQPESGKIFLDGKEVRFKGPRDAIKNGIAYVTEDRKQEGLVLPMSVHHNVTLAFLKNFVRHGIIQSRKEDAVVKEQVKTLNIKVANVKQTINSLSGGNQQKVVLAKWMITAPRIIIFDEPTRGIDVGAKVEIYKIMCEFVAQGNAIILVSSEMPEAMGMSDRIIVLSNHKYSGELRREEFSEEAIAQLQFKHMVKTLN